MYIDSTPYGLKFDRVSNHGNVSALGLSYKWLSGLALSICAGIGWLSGWLGVMVKHNTTGRMACNTTVHSLQFEVGLLVISFHVSLGVSYGKRNDALVEESIKTHEKLKAAAAAFRADLEKPPATHEDGVGYTPDFGTGSLRQGN